MELICTDIPYAKSFLLQVEELGKFAKRVLVDGGIFVTYAGQYWLHKVIESLSKSLTYRWVIASTWQGDANLVHLDRQGSVLSKWKPILVFSNGGFRISGQWHDLCKFPQKEKSWHDYQQPLAEVETLIRNFSEPGDLVVDPCGGGFTTAVACLNQNRRFVGCDVEEENVAMGQERIMEEVGAGAR